MVIYGIEWQEFTNGFGSRHDGYSLHVSEEERSKPYITRWRRMEVLCLRSRLIKNLVI